MFGAQTSNGWCTECITKSLSAVGWLARQIKANEFQKKNQYCKKAGVKIESWNMIFMPSGMIFSPVEICELLSVTCLRFLVVCGCHWNWTGRKNHTTAGIICFFLTNTLICNWLFFLKTGSIITKIKSVWSSNHQWLVHWMTLQHNKKSQHCWLTRIADQGEWIPKKKQYCKKAGVKFGSLWYDFMPSHWYDFFPSWVSKLLAATCLRFLVVCGCHWKV